MADEKRHPMGQPSKRYSVQLWDDRDAIRFEAVDGLDDAPQTTELRHGNSPVFYPIKMPGLGRVGNVVILRQGTAGNGSRLQALHDEIKANEAAPRTVVVHRLNEAGAAQQTWTLENARPIRISTTEPETEGGEVVVESVELAFEG